MKVTITSNCYLHITKIDFFSQKTKHLFTQNNVFNTYKTLNTSNKLGNQ